MIKGHLLLLAGAAAMGLTACQGKVQPAATTAPVLDSERVVITEPVAGSDYAVHLAYVETIDGLYTPIGIRKPDGEGPFPVIVFASGNGGLGMAWVREATQNRSWTQEQFL